MREVTSVLLLLLVLSSGWYYDGGQIPGTDKQTIAAADGGQIPR